MKKHKPLVFSQEIPPYRHDFLVCIGADSKDAIRYVKKSFIKKLKKDFIELLETRENLFIEIKNGKQGGFAVANLDEHYLILILPKLEDNWDYWECLIHELSHILDWICDWKMLNGETEARAYLHEYLFRQIRRKIQGIDKI